MTASSRKSLFKKTTPFLSNKKHIMMTAVFGALMLSGCASKDLSASSKQYYHAPAQAYNLFLGNAAITGKPTLRESCSEKGSTLEIIDATGDYFRVDVLNLKAYPNLVTADTKQSVSAIASFYGELYDIPETGQYYRPVRLNKKKQLYMPLVLENMKPESKQYHNPVVGMLLTRYNGLLFNVQHVQKQYNEKQMLQKLDTIQRAMAVPGSFQHTKVKKLTDKAGKDISQPQGFLTIDPETASAEQITEWRNQARC